MTIKLLWHKLSYTGLGTQPDEFDFREVVLLNKMAVASALAVLLIIPIEIIINGWTMVPFEIGMSFFAGFSIVLNYYKKYTFSKYYFFIMANAIILSMGLATGKGSGNEFFLLLTFILPLILFKNLSQSLVLSLLVFISFFFLRYLQTVVTPVIAIPLATKELIQPVFLGIVFLLLFLSIFYFKSINHHFQDMLNLKNEEIQLKNKEIIDSINYAKRIQDAILPPISLVKQYLPDSFILYKPKDIVAGDFYWIEQVNDLILFAVADCTGHGVPGALVSIVCNNALNRTVREFRLTQPGEILDKTRFLVMEQFEKSEKDVKDGMDIALCSLNTSTGELRYAGANNPLWIIKNNSLEEIKPDKQPIGRYAEEKPFLSHVLHLQKDDTLYLFSDGFADQFGGEKGKKYKYKPLKNLLLTIHTKPLEEQRTLIDNEFLSWKKNLEQVDDVCVMGVRMKQVLL